MCPLRDGIRDRPINADGGKNHCQSREASEQQRVEPWLGNGRRNQLLHSGHFKNRHVGVCRLNGLADGIGHGQRVFCCANNQRNAVHQEGAGSLGIGKINIELRLIPHAGLPDIARDTDDRIPGCALKDLNPMAERIPVGPHALRETFADNCHRQGSEAITVLEEAPLG